MPSKLLLYSRGVCAYSMPKCQTSFWSWLLLCNSMLSFFFIFNYNLMPSRRN